MTEPVWLDRLDAVGIHDMMIAQYGGLAGIRDEGLLESALARPRNHYVYGEQSLHVLSAMYGAGVVKNHPFVDGNKRTGFMLAATFLELNGWVFTATEESVVTHTLGLAAGEVSEEEYAVWIAANSHRTDG
jgi:death-on-curing protein